MLDQYNLIVMGNILDSAVSKSQSGAAHFPKDRLFESTSKELIASYEGNLTALTELPTLILGEANPFGKARTPAFLSRIDDIGESRGYITFHFNHVYSNLTSEEVYASRLLDIDIDGPGFTENQRTHWAIKKGDLDARVFEFLQSRDSGNRPKFFSVSDWPPSISGHVAVMMPFDKAFNSVYEEIKVSCHSLNLETKRVDEVYKPGKVIDDIFSIIAQSRVIVSDLSDRNPNVLYEVGLAHALNRDVIMLVQDEEDVPFDLRQFRFVKYSMNTEGLIALRENLKRSIQEVLD